MIDNKLEVSEVEKKLWSERWLKQASKPQIAVYEKAMCVFEGLGYWEESGKAAASIDIPTNGIVLDLGCGVGEVTGYLPVTQCFGLDLSKEQIERAKRRFPHCRFLVGDAENLPFKENFFDFIIATNLLHHLSDPAHCLKECYRALKPGGVIVTVDTNSMSPFGWLTRTVAKIFKLQNELPAFPQFALSSHEKQFSKREYQKLFQNSPFQNFKIRPHRLERLSFFLPVIFPFLGSLPGYATFLFYLMQLEESIVQVPLIEYFCYFWIAEAKKDNYA